MAKERLFDNPRFNFVGGISHGQEPMTVKRLNDTSKWFKTKLGIGIKDGVNSPYLTMETIHEGATPSEIRLMTDEFDDKGNRIWITVPYEDTTKEEVLNRLPDFLKITIDLETDFEKKAEYTKLIFKKRNHEIEINKLKALETLTDEEKVKLADNLEKVEEYSKQIKELATKRKELILKDAIVFLNQALPMLKDKKLRVIGTPKCNYYKGKNQLQYIPSLIEIVPNDTPNQLKLFFDLFYDKESIEDDKKERKLYINGYIGETKDKADKLYPINVVMDYSKVNEEVQQEKELLDYQRSTFETKNKKAMYKNNIEVNVINGAEQVEFSIDTLTEKQKTQVRLGLATLEKFKPNKPIYGDRVQELKFFRATLKGKFEDGSIEVFDSKDLGDYLVADDSDKKIEDVKKEEPKVEEKKEETKSDSNEDLMSKLFG